MRSRNVLLLLALLASTSPAFAGEGPNPVGGSATGAGRPAAGGQVAKAPDAATGAARETPAAGLPSKALVKKRARAAAAAKGRAEFEAALNRQALIQQHADLQNGAMAQQQSRAMDPLQQQRMLQQLSPQGATVVAVNPDGTYRTTTYYSYPTVITPGTMPQPGPPIIPFYP
jgi:hypothetical protein